MTKIVCNSSPIIALSMINKLHLLWDLFDEVIVPKEVYREITHGNHFKTIGIDELEQAIRDEKIFLYNVQQIELVDQLYGRLHGGELEVIIAAKELNIPLVIMDDRAARNFAETLLLKSIGVRCQENTYKQDGEMHLQLPLHLTDYKGIAAPKSLP